MIPNAARRRLDPSPSAGNADAVLGRDRRAAYFATTSNTAALTSSVTDAAVTEMSSRARYEVRDGSIW
jgi:hypothetical protein